jgi:hypothetical protein
MPDFCFNHMTITGAVEEIARFKQTCIIGEGEDATLDFNTVIPMPAMLQGSEVSSVVDDGLRVLGRGDLLDDKLPANFPRSLSLAEMLDFPWVKAASIQTVEELKTFLIERNPEIIPAAQRAIICHEQTGFLNWYDWSCANWGTKWNACEFHIERDEPTYFECSFDTAWGPPQPVWKKIGELFPTLEFELDGEETSSELAFTGSIRAGHLKLYQIPPTTVDEDVFVD